MKKRMIYLMVTALSLSTFIPANATGIDPKTTTTKTTEATAEMQVMMNRLEEIKGMDKSEMTRVEKKDLRKEVRAIKAQARSSSNGVYLSVGAIIIIVLLLIILL
ncbi:hypothetical protein [Flavobacterium sp.]